MSEEIQPLPDFWEPFGEGLIRCRFCKRVTTKVELDTIFNADVLHVAATVCKIRLMEEIRKRASELFPRMFKRLEKAENEVNAMRKRRRQ